MKDRNAIDRTWLENYATGADTLVIARILASHDAECDKSEVAHWENWFVIPWHSRRKQAEMLVAELRRRGWTKQRPYTIGGDRPPGDVDLPPSALKPDAKCQCGQEFVWRPGMPSQQCEASECRFQNTYPHAKQRYAAAHAEPEKDGEDELARELSVVFHGHDVWPVPENCKRVAAKVRRMDDAIEVLIAVIYGTSHEFRSDVSPDQKRAVAKAAYEHVLREIVNETKCESCKNRRRPYSGAACTADVVARWLREVAAPGPDDSNVPAQS